MRPEPAQLFGAGPVECMPPGVHDANPRTSPDARGDRGWRAHVARKRAPYAGPEREYAGDLRQRHDVGVLPAAPAEVMLGERTRASDLGSGRHAPRLTAARTWPASKPGSAARSRREPACPPRIAPATVSAHRHRQRIPGSRHVDLPILFLTSRRLVYDRHDFSRDARRPAPQG